MEPSSSRSIFPDKKRESISQAWSVTSPSGRPNNRMQYGRLGSNSRSSDEGPMSLRRITSFGSTSEPSNSLKIFVYTPQSSPGSPSVDRQTHDALLDMTREAQNDENRPPSPRPSDSTASLYEHNKQIHIWDDWSSSIFHGAENDIASIKYKRTSSENLPKDLPKNIESQLSDDLDF